MIKPVIGGTAGGLLRATHLLPSLAVTAFAATLSAAAGRGPAGTAAVAAAVVAGQFSVGWANDWLDAGRDRRVGRRDKPVVAGSVGVETLRRAALLALAACVPLSLLSGVGAGLAHLAAVALAWGYDLGLKATRWSAAPYAGSFALLAVFVTLGLPGGQAGPWWAPLGAGLLGAGAHFTNALPDLADDEATGVRGLPQRLGAGGSMLAAAALLGSGLLVVTLGPTTFGGPPALAGLVVGSLCVAAAVVAGLRRHPRRAFPFAIAAAGCAVVSLVTVAPQLAG